MKPQGGGPAGLRAILKMMSFSKLHGLGWADVIPIIPPRGELHPTAEAKSAYLRENRGKAPGIRNSEGTWTGLAWRVANVTLDKCRYWDRMFAEDANALGPQIGYRCGNLIALDCDVPDKDLSKALLKAVTDYLHELGVPEEKILLRVGNSPKWMIPVRLPIGQVRPTQNIKVQHAACPGAGFQLLGNGAQVVIWGEHPKTGLAYKWEPQSPASYADLPELTLEQIDALVGVIEAAVKAAGGSIERHGVRHLDGAPPPQDELKGDRALIADALAAIPNTLTTDYGEWIAMCAAVKGASQDWPDEGLRLWNDWCLRWPGLTPETRDPDGTEKWNQLRPPYRLGADFLYSRAHEYGWDSAQVDFKQFMVERDEAVTERVTGGDTLGWTLREATLVARAMAESQHSQFAEKAVAHRFVEAYRGKLIYAGERETWYGWTGRVWTPDTTHLRVGRELQFFISQEVDRFLQSAAAQEMPLQQKQKFVIAVRGRTFHERVLRFLPELMNVSVELFDTFDYLLNTPAGAVDLRTGATTELSAAQIVTRITSVPVAPAGTPCPQWTGFLEQATQGDTELVQFLQRAMGYTLWGKLSEHALFYLYGSGGNGKSVFLDVMADVLGGFATVADRSVFLKTRFPDHSTTRASLAGYRYIQVPEVNEAADWNDAVIKEWSAGNWVKARFVRQNEFAFRPEGTLWFSGNSKPRLHKVDPAIERRMKMIEFTFRPAKPDITLKDRLVREEGAAILRWAVEGARMWMQQGLGTCRHVERATRDYLAEFDPVRKWVAERCFLEVEHRGEDGAWRPWGSDDRTGGRAVWDFSSDLFEDYQRWCKTEMVEALSQRTFILRLTELPGVTLARSKDARRLKGISRRIRDAGAIEREEDILS